MTDRTRTAAFLRALCQREGEHPGTPDVRVVVHVETDKDAVAVAEVSNQRGGFDLDLGLVRRLLRAQSCIARVDVDLGEQLRPDASGAKA